jgi:hypothetical protein
MTLKCRVGSYGMWHLSCLVSEESCVSRCTLKMDKAGSPESDPPPPIYQTMTTYPRKVLLCLPLALHPWVGPDLLFRLHDRNIFVRWGFQRHAQPPSWVSLSVCCQWVSTQLQLNIYIYIYHIISYHITFDRSGMGDPTSSYTTASIAPRDIWPWETLPVATLLPA